MRERGAYYNEIDPFAAQWLRNLISAGHLPAGDVDDRSIVDVRPGDLAGYTQCHFFAGIGGWGHALRLAGWPDERPIWTGSCPCQPFSNAGKGAGTDDPRHLWPDLLRLIRAVRPPVVMGEQVAGSAGYGWLDGVCADLAGEDYASRGVDIPACAVDAPHIRNRLYWIAVADADQGRDRTLDAGGAGAGLHGDAGQSAGPHGGEPLADADHRGRDGRSEDQERTPLERAIAERADARGGQLFWHADAAGLAVRPLSHSGRGPVLEEGSAAVEADHGHGGRDVADANIAFLQLEPSARQLPVYEQDVGVDLRPGSRNEPGTFWSRSDRLLCHDGKTRRTQPGVPLLVNGVRGRVALGLALGEASHPHADQLINRIGVWKGAGNAIVPQEAEQVIRAYMDVAP